MLGRHMSQGVYNPVASPTAAKLRSPSPSSSPHVFSLDGQTDTDAGASQEDAYFTELLSYSLERLSKEPELLKADQEETQRQARHAACHKVCLSHFANLVAVCMRNLWDLTLDHYDGGNAVLPGAVKQLSSGFVAECNCPR